jgi:hypothetical protein
VQTTAAVKKKQKAVQDAVKLQSLHESDLKTATKATQNLAAHHNSTTSEVGTVAAR